MGVTVVVGGQYGSEGKGKLVVHLARTATGPVAVARCGGPNSGHTVEFRGTPYPFRQLPSAAVVHEVPLFLSAGMVIDPSLLGKELQDLAVDRSRLHVDRNAVVLDGHDRKRERRSRLRSRVGSTLSGTGSATARKVLRDSTQRRMSELPEFRDVVIDVSSRLNDLVDDGFDIIVEGTQGIGLSLHHSDCYPYATSRDTTAAAFLSEVGLSPLLVQDVLLVLRTYPIRVGGNSGPLAGEITWDELTRRSGSPQPLMEMTTVTGRMRRVAEFDWDQALKAVRISRPTGLVLHGLDYVDFDDRGLREGNRLGARSKALIAEIESRLRVPVVLGFTGPQQDDVIEFRKRRAGSETQKELSHV